MTATGVFQGPASQQGQTLQFAAAANWRGPQILVIEIVSNGYILRDNREGPQSSTNQFVERSLEQLLDRIRSVLGEPFAPQDGG